MIKLTYCLRRLPSLSRAEFQQYWLETHAPLVASVKDALRIRRYVQLHSLPVELAETMRPSRGGPPSYDGVAQIWWDSLEDMAAALNDSKATDAGRSLLEDERRFIDLANSPLWWGEEKVIF